MSGWHKGPMLAWDLETSSADPTTARIVTATVVTIDPPAQVREKKWLVAVEDEIPAEAIAIHGITTEHAREHGEDPRIVTREIAAALSLGVRAGVPIIAFNFPYDGTVLDYELTRFGLPSLEDFCGGPVRRVVDPLVIDRAVDKYRRGSRKLVDQCAHYGVRLDGAHDSSFDAIAAARIAWALANRYPDEVGGIDLDELHERQVA